MTHLEPVVMADVAKAGPSARATAHEGVGVSRRKKSSSS